MSPSIRGRRFLRPILCPIAAAVLVPFTIMGTLGAQDSPPPRLLVLNNGRVVEGRISQSAGGYVVEKPRGNMVIPFDQVAFPAHDLRDAYARLRQRQSRGATAETHLETARWCVTHQLYDEARAELGSALTLDEKNREARSMLKRLDEVLRPAGTATPPDEALQNSQGFERPEARSLAGLSQETARVFVSRIQPMLLRKCGNAGCHGSTAENGFQLTHTRTHRVFAERNLAMVLQFVDSHKPLQSPLIVRPQGNHGPAGETIFNGSLGAEQLEALQVWVTAAVEDQRKNIDRSRLLADGANADDLLLIRGRPERDAKESAAAAPPDDLLERVLREEREDAFDPEEFNRRFADDAVKAD